MRNHPTDRQNRRRLSASALASVFIAGWLCLTPSTVFSADDETPQPVEIDVPNPKAWVGQRLSFTVKVRAPGSFVGATSFTLPQISRAVIVQVGSPVVSSEDVGDESWFVQTHEFALYSQASGQVTIPAFEVRYSNRDGFTGPSTDHSEQTPAAQVEIQRPPDQAPNVFLVTTDNIKVEEKWEPSPGKAQQGDVIQRVITQTADEVSGMVLAPPPSKVPEGVQVYLKSPEVTDNTERGEFTGQRRDTVKYQLQRSGQITLPAIRYVWWDPEKESFGSTTLPEVTFDVAAAPQPHIADTDNQNRAWLPWIMLTVAALIAFAATQTQRIRGCWQTLHRWWNPPERVASKKLIQACQSNNASAAEAAWSEWQNVTSSDQNVSAELNPAELDAAIMELHRSLYGGDVDSSWNGQPLRQAFERSRQHGSVGQFGSVGQLGSVGERVSRPLPPLNPL